MQPDDSDELPYSCPNCHAAMPANEDLCDECGFHQVLGKVIDLDGIDRPDKSTGFERTLKRHLSETTTAESALLWFRIFLAFMALSFVAFLRLALGRRG